MLHLGKPGYIQAPQLTVCAFAVYMRGERESKRAQNFLVQTFPPVFAIKKPTKPRTSVFSFTTAILLIFYSPLWINSAFRKRSVLFSFLPCFWDQSHWGVAWLLILYHPVHSTMGINTIKSSKFLYFYLRVCQLATTIKNKKQVKI